MHTIKNSKMEKKLETKFVKYDQSDKVKSFNGSSVSYAAGVTYLKWEIILFFYLFWKISFIELNNKFSYDFSENKN